MSRNKSARDILILIVVSGLLFLLGNNIISLTNDNEVFYAQTAKEMIQQNTWSTPYLFGQPQFEKPIFSYWLFKLAFVIFGVNAAAARFFPAIFGILGVVTLYWLGLLGFKDRSKAFLSSIILMSGGMYIGLAKSVFTDMFFSVLIMMSFLFFFFAYANQKKKLIGLILSAICMGFAVLTKGPLGILIPFLAVVAFLLIKKNLKFLFCKDALWAFLFLFITVAPWYMLMIQKYGNTFINEFILNDNLRRAVEAQHGGHDTWYYYPSLIVSGMLPWSLFVLGALVFLYKGVKQKENSFYIFLLCWIGSVFLIFQAAHSKVANYIFPVFAPIALLTGGFIRDILSNNKHKSILYVVLSVISFFVLAIPIALFFSSQKYANYITNRAGVYFLVTGFLLLAAAILFCIYRKKLSAAIYLVGAMVPIFLCSLPLTHNNFEPYISSKDASEYLLKNSRIDNTIICSKTFVRGVKYYTDCDVAVLDMSGKQFFSKHPIIFLSSDHALREFLLKQATTYCIVGKSSVGDIKRAAAADFEVNVLKVIGNEYIIKVKRLGA
ncbi:MAG: phospholipid carrier-dependent glycosyltransferase [Candidatus Omnitrophica bacterium]|nr:phospholipid carrier-dependent glycosyltransferase [Candidatus Omnitrophota bacterium]